MLPRSLTILALSLCALVAEEGELRDVIFPKNGPPIEAFEVVSEGADEVAFKMSSQAAPSKRKTREILRIDYGGMREGPFKAASNILAQGKFAEAATAFRAVADGSKEWERVYGALLEGEALERAGKFADAARAFGVVGSGPAFEAHRMRLDASYRQGFALALAKSPEADKIIASLADLAKGRVGPPADVRANAIKAAQAVAKDPNAKIDDLARKALFRTEEVDAWLHFNRWLADTYRKQGRAKEAARAVDSLLSAIEKDPNLVDPADIVDLRLLKGLVTAESDPQGAIAELLKIDLLPYGSVEQQGKARLTAAKLLLAEAKMLESDPSTAKDEKKAAFVVEQRATAKHLLAAAGGASESEAKQLLGTLK